MFYIKNISLVLLFWLFSCQNKKSNIEVTTEGKSFPEINLLLMDSTYINTKTVSGNKPIVLLYFSPFCPFCKTLIQNILKDNKMRNEIQFVMLSDFPLKELKSYYIKYNLGDYSNLLVGQDYKQYFNLNFKIPGIPCMAIYGKDKNLNRLIIGIISTKMLRDIALG